MRLAVPNRLAPGSHDKENAVKSKDVDWLKVLKTCQCSKLSDKSEQGLTMSNIAVQNLYALSSSKPLNAYDPELYALSGSKPLSACDPAHVIFKTASPVNPTFQKLPATFLQLKKSILYA